MKKTFKSAKPVSAEAIAKLADQGKDVSGFFKNQGHMVQPIHRVKSAGQRPSGRPFSMV
jgi:hypothetical protein